MNCRHCATPLEHVFLDLGFAPPSNAYVTPALMEQPERHYPLTLFVCARCWLVQTKDYVGVEELFSSDYAYLSSVSSSWLTHARTYCEMITRRLRLDGKSRVIEVASNDGYLLKNFVAAGIPCLGIEPTTSSAAVAEKLGIPVRREFFGRKLGVELAAAGERANLIVANNVFAHVPDINDFSAGLKAALKPTGTVTLEFPHLMRLIERVQFDTVYHEHFSYLSLTTVRQILAAAGLRVLDVEELSTHGGSLRVYAGHNDDSRREEVAVARILTAEEQCELRTLAPYRSFQARADRVKDDLLLFLVEQKRAGRRVAAYGAAAKGTTLLNYGGVKPDLLPYVCDAAASKQGKFLPGSHLPIHDPIALRQRKPDVVLILPWNLADEVMAQYAYVREWGGEFWVAVPALRRLG